ncbi:amidohydrolase family protein [Paenibacillus silviterrae]|uniref:amidohydrolase family protein n=1 Tax=Paenibacillus silviterrae TaxID=3242194 RepID=UPI002543E452|nr:amidohydrolase family protein [Paenibacillus chinjuensis]
MHATENSTHPSGAANSPDLHRAIIDCDIHHFTGTKAIKSYLPRALADLMSTYGAALPSGTPSGGPAQSVKDVAALQEEHLNPNHVAYGILTGESYGAQGVGNPHYSAAICSAINDYTKEQWLSVDNRLRGSIFVTKQDPLLAAKEIDRLAGSGQWAQVIFSNGAQLPFGNRFYSPIYEACVRHNLPVMIHAGMEGGGTNSPTTGAGYVTHLAEWKAARIQTMMAHMASFIFEGTFETFPELRIVLNEGGAFWIAPYLWRLDLDWKSLRVQTPWVKRLPSEYFREHFRVTSQSLETAPDEATFHQYMTSIHAQDTLMFCSNLPYHEADTRLTSLPGLDEALQERILYSNAAELYNL